MVAGVDAPQPGQPGPVSRLLAKINPEAVGLRAAPFTAVYLLVAAALLRAPGSEHLDWLIGSAAAVMIIQLVASLGRWRRWPRWAQYLLPLAQMSCLVGLDYASSLNPSYFTVMLFLPVVSLALQPSTIGVALGTIATAVIVFGAASASLGRIVDDPVTLFSIGFVTACALLVGVGVYAITQRLRDRTDALLSLQAEQEQAVRTLADQHERLTELTDRLAESRDLLRSVVDATTEVVVVAADEDGRILLAGPGTERVLGVSPQGLIGTNVIDLTDRSVLRAAALARGWEDSTTSELQVLVGAAGHGDPEVQEGTFRRPDGQTLQMELVVTRRRMLDESRAQGYLFIATDLTEQRESERLQDEFIGLVSHELRTPLASILGYTSLLQADKGRLAADERRYLEVIDRNAQRLMRLVDDLLLSVQVVAGTFSLTPQETDVATVVGESVANLEPAAAASRVAVGYRAPDPVPLLTDPGRLAQVVENLLTNAVKFAPVGGNVWVELTGGTSADGRRQATVTVSDDGPGMTEEEITHATQRFFRSRSARRQRVRGLGLGLSIVDAIVTAHGGTMAITSEPGSGSTIAVTLTDLILGSHPQTERSAAQ